MCRGGLVCVGELCVWGCVCVWLCGGVVCVYGGYVCGGGYVWRVMWGVMWGDYVCVCVIVEGYDIGGLCGVMYVGGVSSKLSRRTGPAEDPLMIVKREGWREEAGIGGD